MKNKAIENDSTTLAWRYKASPYSQQWFATTSKEISEMYDDAEPLVSAITVEELNHEVDKWKKLAARLNEEAERHANALWKAQELLRRISGSDYQDSLKAIGEAAQLFTNTESKENS